jgi:dihydroorotate dehydrogenase electron transfer subunit
LYQIRTLITDTKILAPAYYRFTLLAPDIAAIAKPGQFIQIRVASSGTNDPLLSRPISIFNYNRESGNVDVIFKVVGRGTASLAEFTSGELLEIVGPIGNGFQVPQNARNIALIAGGVGMPPLFCLAEYLKCNDHQKLSLFYGARSAIDFLELDLWAQTGAKIFAATDDGSHGYHGLVTELFMEQQRQTPFDFLAACGPQLMLQAVQKIAIAEGISGQLSLEAHMACAIGACLGCTCKTTHGLKRVCVDGPIFPLDEVVWS